MFSHLDEKNNPKMVDVSPKTPTSRTARAEAFIRLPEGLLLEGEELYSKKGPVFQTARLAGIMAAKKTAELIPLCHTIALEDCALEFSMPEPRLVRIEASVRATHKTGVEMEALVAASTAALTVYDMCKAFGHFMTIENIRLLEKKGGKSDYEVSIPSL
jgi:cyclic pyranopterin phosphate synthase